MEAVSRMQHECPDGKQADVFPVWKWRFLSVSNAAHLYIMSFRECFAPWTVNGQKTVPGALRSCRQTGKGMTVRASQVLRQAGVMFS